MEEEQRPAAESEATAPKTTADPRLGSTDLRAADDHPEIAALYAPALRTARIMILVVGILYAVSGLLFYLVNSGAMPDTVLNIILAVNLVLTAVHIGLFMWAKKAPLAASVVALVLFVTLHATEAIIDPSSIHKGLIIKIVFIILLVQGIRAGLKTRRLLSEGSAD